MTATDRHDDGYAMAALLVGLAVMTVAMTVAMPVWKQMVQREKEAELIFRGEQYAHAIGLFQRRNGPGTLPPTIDVLVQQHFLRKKFRDPITNDDFQPLFAGQPTLGAPQPGSAQPGSAARGRGPASPPTAGNAALPGGGVAGGVMGVTSKSTNESIRLYKGRSHYNEWAFVYVAQAQAPGAVGAGGNRGAGSQRSSQPGVGGALGAGTGGRRGGAGGRGPLGPSGPGTGVSPPNAPLPPRRPGV